jgi:guanylate kinase
MNNKHKNFIIILSSPSGAGKTTICRALLKEFSDIRMSVSVTTRAKRDGEEDGVDYNFISEEEFNSLISGDALLEHATVHSCLYGTPRKAVDNTLSDGMDALFDIDWQGTLQVKEKLDSKIVSIFILPPSLAELERRLRNRASDSEEVIRNRLNESKVEMEKWPNYDYVVVNDDVDIAIDQVKSIIKVERLKRQDTAALLKKIS